MTAKIVNFSVETHIHIVKLQNQLSSKYPTFFSFCKDTIQGVSFFGTGFKKITRKPPNLQEKWRFIGCDFIADL